MGFWWPLFSWDSDIATCSTQAVSGTVNAGTNVITVSSTTGFTVGSLIYIDNGTIANSEWGRQKALSTNVSVTIEDNLNNAQTGSNMYTAAQFIQCVLDVSMFTRMRVVADGKDAGQNCAVEVLYTTCDSFG